MEKMLKNVKKIYIAGALTYTDEKQKLIYKKIADICSEFCSDVYVPHLRGTDPVKNPEVSPNDVWQIDHREIATSDLIIAYVGKPALGVGGELEIARITNSDIILWNFNGEKVSRLALGNPAVVERVEAEDEDDLFNKITKTLKEKYFHEEK